MALLSINMWVQEAANLGEVGTGTADSANCRVGDTVIVFVVVVGAGFAIVCAEGVLVVVGVARVAAVVTMLRPTAIWDSSTSTAAMPNIPGSEPRA